MSREYGIALSRPQVRTFGFLIYECFDKLQLSLFYRLSLPNEMLENILAFEESIGDAVTIDESLRFIVMREKRKFNAVYIDKIRRKLEIT